MLSELSIQGVRDRMLLLRSLPAFAPLEDHALGVLAEHMRVRTCKPGEVLLEMGAPVHHAYVVLEGHIQWERAGFKPTISERMQVVGWLTLMARDAQGMNAVCIDDAIVLELPAEALEHALEDDFGIVRNSLRLGATGILASRDNLPAPDPPPAFEMGVLRSERRTLVERLIDMRGGPLFARANAEALIALVRSSTEIRVEPGRKIWEIGEPSTFWFFVEYGRVRCTNQAGRSQELGANFVIGIMDALAQVPRSFDVVADTLVVATKIELEAFLGVMESHNDLARDFLAFLAHSVLDVQAKLSQHKG
jgi:CRP-like cAMP-binding protein